MHRNLHFAILNELMDADLLPAFDVAAFFTANRPESFDPNNDYDFAPLDDVADHLALMTIDDTLLAKLTELSIYAGTTLQHQIFPQWSGEDDYFDVPTLDGLQQCVNLRSLSVQLLPPNDPADIRAVAHLPNLSEIEFNGGVLTDLQPLLDCLPLKRISFLVTDIHATESNKTAIDTLRSRGCTVTCNAPRGLIV